MTSEQEPDDVLRGSEVVYGTSLIPGLGGYMSGAIYGVTLGLPSAIELVAGQFVYVPDGRERVSW